MKKFTIYFYSCFLAFLLLSAESHSQICSTATVSAGADQTICAGASVNLSASIGSAISTVTWSAVGGGTFTPNANALNVTFTPSAAQVAAGSVSISITTNDPPGLCLSATDQVLVTINASVTVNAGLDQSVCAGNSVALAGTITGGASTGTWSGGAGAFSPNASALVCAYTPAASEIAAGSVTLTLTSSDPPGPCVAASDQVVISITSPTVNAGADQVICAGSSVSLSGSAGAGISNVTWSGGSGVFNPNPNSLNCVYMPTASEVASGSLNLTLSSDVTTSGMGTDDVLITINAAATVNASVDQTVCAGTAVSLSGSIGGSASAGAWSGGGGTFVPNANTPNCFYLPSASEVATGSVALTLTTNDPSGPCPAVNDAMTITINASVTVNASIDQTVCAGSSVNLSGSISGGISTGAWSGGSGTFSPNANSINCVYIPSAADIAAGTVTLTLTSDDPGGPCGPESDQLVITILPLPNVSISAGGSTTICQGNSVALTASAGASYLWSTTAITQSISANASGNYSVTVTDGNGCSTSASVSVTVNALPGVSVSASATAICQGDAAILTSSPCAGYLWSTGALTQTISVNAAGTYSVMVTDTNGCSNSASVSITVHALPSVSVTANGSASICQGDSVELTAGVFSSYLWSTAAASASIYVNAAGSYSVTVTDTNGCSASAAITIVVHATPTVSISAGGATTICAGDSVQLTASAGTSYLWSTGNASQSIMATATGTYSVNVTDGNGCTGSASISILVNAVPLVNLGADTSLCYGQSLLLDAGNAGATFAWNTTASTQTISVSASGNIYVAVTNSDGCSASDTIQVTIATSPVTVNLGSDTTAYLCHHNGIVLDAGIGASSYFWNTAAVTQTISVTVNGAYYVTVNVGGCTGSDTINVTIADNTIDLDLGPDTTVCGCVQLSAYSAGATYDWCSGQQYSTINVCNSGTYCVEVSNGMCKAWDTIAVVVASPPVVNLGNDTVLLNGSIVLNAGNAGATFGWNTGATAQTITVTASGAYYVSVTNQWGCTAADTINIGFVNGVQQLGASASSLQIYPNPSSGGYFTLKFEMPEQGLAEIRIYNQLGAQVYWERKEKFRGVYEKTMACQHLLPGLYFAEVMRNGHRSIAKVTID
jgi:hypothetical protein